MATDKEKRTYTSGEMLLIMKGKEIGYKQGTIETLKEVLHDINFFKVLMMGSLETIRCLKSNIKQRLNQEVNMGYIEKYVKHDIKRNKLAPSQR